MIGKATVIHYLIFMDTISLTHLLVKQYLVCCSTLDQMNSLIHFHCGIGNYIDDHFSYYRTLTHYSVVQRCVD